MIYLLPSFFLFSIFAVASSTQLHHIMTLKDMQELFGIKEMADIPQYDVFTPFQVDHNGQYVTHNLDTVHKRAKREQYHAVRHVPAHFQFTAFGESHQLTVKPSNEFLAPSFFVQIFGDNDTVYTDFDFEMCHFVGKLTTHSSSSHVAISNCDGLMGVIVTEEGSLIVQPLPDYLVTSHSNTDNHTHLIYKRTVRYQSNSEKPECAVQGTMSASRYDNASRIETDLEMGRLQKENVMDSFGSNLGDRYVVELLLVADADEYRKHNSNVQKIKKYILTLMNIASSLYNINNLGFNVRLVLTRLQLFTSFAQQTRDGLKTGSGQESKQLLRNFSQWQAKKKKRHGDNDPLYYDHAIFLLGRGMCYGENADCWELGRAWIGGMCSVKYSSSIVSDRGLHVGFVIGHEIGHNLGMLHDGAYGKCRYEDGYLMKSTTANAQNIYLFSICSKVYLLNYLRSDETRCLKDTPSAWEDGFGRNFYDHPGHLYSRDQQCKFSFGENATYCHKEPNVADPEICTRLWCDDKRYQVCVTTYTGAADGTFCDAPHWRGSKVCYRRQCVLASQLRKPPLPSYRGLLLPELPITIHPDILNHENKAATTSTPPLPTIVPTGKQCVPNPRRPIIDGKWSSWSSFTPCGRTCGGGFRYREKLCNNPRPSNCGRDCVGHRKDIEFCNFTPCPGLQESNYRQQQCSAHNNMKKGIHLVPVYNVAKQYECRLKCVSISHVEFTLRSPEAAEGTLCNNNGTNDRCYYGKCHPVGCDNVYGSRKTFNRCGVCGGDGSSRNCKTYNNTYVVKHEWSGYYDVMKIPARASNIKIMEISRSSAVTLALSYEDGKSILNGDFNIGPASQSVIVAESKFVYLRSPGAREALTADGPTNQTLIVRMLYNHRFGDYTGIQYSYDMPQSIYVFESAYTWLAKRSHCSVSCGKGITETDLRCARRSSGVEVDISMCFGQLAPRGQRAACGGRNCSTTRYYWVKKKWSPCSRTCGNGVATRRIVCRNGDTGKNVANDYCQGVIRPPVTQPCTLDACPTNVPTPHPVTPLVVSQRPVEPVVVSVNPAGRWIIGNWSACSTTCDKGNQIRSVTCNSTCTDPKPETERKCKMQPCCRDRDVKVCKLLLTAECLGGCNDKEIRRFCCQTCTNRATNTVT